MPIKKHDFINIDFIGSVTETGDIFDVKKESVAKKHNIHNPKANYHALTICVGERHVVPGLDEFLEGKEPGTYTVQLTPEQAFGKKDAKLMRLIPLNIFHQHNMRPEPGLHINMDGAVGVVRSVSGGRVIMDFNHPIAGKNVTYNLTINKIETDTKEKIKTIVTYLMPGLPYDYKEGTLTIKIEFPDQIKKMLTEKMQELLPEIKNVNYEPPPKTEEQQPQKNTTKKEEKTSTKV